MPEDKKFYAVFANNRILNARGFPTIFRFAPAGAKPIVVAELIQTFIYYCPSTKTFDIHEVSTGVRMAEGKTPEQAFKNAAAYLKEFIGHEELFLKQVQLMEKVHRHPVMEFAQAMQYLPLPAPPKSKVKKTRC